MHKQNCNFSFYNTVYSSVQVIFLTVHYYGNYSPEEAEGDGQPVVMLYCVDRESVKGLITLCKAGDDVCAWLKLWVRGFEALHFSGNLKTF